MSRIDMMEFRTGQSTGEEDARRLQAWSTFTDLSSISEGEDEEQEGTGEMRLWGHRMKDGDGKRNRFKRSFVNHSSITLQEDFELMVVNYHLAADGHTVLYTLALHSRTYIVTQKRFREFAMLHGHLQEVLQTVLSASGDKMPQFPSKFFKTSPTQRLVALQEYANQLSLLFRKRIFEKQRAVRAAKRILLKFAGAKVERRVSRVNSSEADSDQENEEQEVDEDDDGMNTPHVPSCISPHTMYFPKRKVKPSQVVHFSANERALMMEVHQHPRGGRMYFLKSPNSVF